MYDVLIVGAGSAGMAAGIYAARFGMKPVIVGRETGGLLNESHKVENYPGFVAIPGFDLMMKFKEHVESLDVPIKNDWVESITKNDDGTFTLKTDKEDLQGKTVIISTGTKHRKLGLAREDELAGKGVSYCATCDAAFNKDLDVAVVGGGDSAALAAGLVAQFANKVYVLVRGDKMKAEPINRKRLEDNPKIEILYNTSPTELIGDQLELVKLNNGADLKVQSLFVEIGADVQSELAVSLGVSVNERKEIVIDQESKTNVEAVYAAGDCCNRAYKQAITGVAEGVIAAFSAYDYIKRKESDEGANIGY